VIDPGSLRRACGTHWFRVAAAALGAAVLVTVLYSALGLSPLLATFQEAVVHSVSMAGLAGLIVPRVMRRLGVASAAARWAWLIPLLLCVALAGTSLSCGVLSFGSMGWRRDFGACFATAYWINALLSAVISMGMILYQSQRDRLDALTLELRTSELEHERAHKMALEARLSSLEARLHPHFLFNTLNAISCLIQDDPDRAERTVERLASLLRFSLDATQRGLVPLGQELDIVADYLEIEKTRLGDRLSWTLDVTGDVKACDVPPLTVQTLVENSIKHAIAPRRSGGRLRIEASEADDRLVLAVWDDGPGFTPAAMCPGHGLETLQGRLAARFGPAASLTVGRRDGGTVVTVALPRARGGEA
jgi:two-component system, LytTR family, sensor histidine kinase AlgZ